jgi:glycosyltransferase involved in cell wall biosynthesis
MTEYSQRVALVTNIPTPYRIPVYGRLARLPGCDLRVVYCSGSEPDRAWRVEKESYRTTYLKPRFLSFGGRFVHINLDVWTALRDIQPEVIITTGFNPTHLLAFAYACWAGVPHVAMTDGTLNSEKKLGAIHRWVRRIVYGRSAAFLGPSEGAKDLYASYGVPSGSVFKSHLCADNDAFHAQPRDSDRPHDLLFCGRMAAVKNPLFVLQVAEALAQRLHRVVRVAFLGSGEMEAQVRESAAALAGRVEVVFLGFVQSKDLPIHYAQAKIFVFPTSWDPWGVVANEACAAGLPVLVTPEAGAVGDLLLDQVNAMVLPLDVQAWAEAALRLLTDELLYQRMSLAGLQRVMVYHFDAAAQGIWSAVQHARVARGR